jgi:hypothetical protein
MLREFRLEASLVRRFQINEILQSFEIETAGNASKTVEETFTHEC